MKIYLNNEWQQFDILKAPPIKTAIDDSLDTATVVFYADFKEAIEKNTLVNIHNKIMCVYNDQSTPLSKAKNVWQHTLSLIEATHLLDLIFVNNICLTNREDTLYEQMIKLSQNIGVFCNFFVNPTQLHPNLINALNGLKSAEIYCVNSTAKECFNELLRTINARVELEVQYVENSTQPIQYWINYRSGNKRNNLVTFEKMSSLYTYDSNTMTNNLTFIGQNAVTRYPITQGYEGFKTTEQVLTTDNASIILMHEIEDIVSLHIMFTDIYQVNILDSQTGLGYGEGSILKEFTIEVDLTDSLIEQEAYDLLNSSEQQDKIPYSRSNVIKNGTTNLLRTLLLGTGDKISQLAFSKGGQYVEEHINELMENDPDYPPSDEYYYTVLVELKGVPIQDIAYKIKYYPFLNVYGNLTKDVKKNNTFTIVDNQQEEVLSLEKYSDLLDNKIKRIGNLEIEIDETNQPLKELNDYTEDGYVIYEREIAESTNEIKAHYKLSKDYNLLNQRIAVDQKKRLFEIPLNYQDCYLTPKYTMKATTKIDEDINMTFLSNNLKVACVSTLLGKVSFSSLPDVTYTLDQSVRGILFTTEKNNQDISTKYLSCGTYAFKDTLHFLMLTYDNYSSALSIGGRVLGGKKAIYNAYCDDYGEFDKISFALCIKNPSRRMEDVLSYPNESAAGQVGSIEKSIEFYKDRVQRICIDVSAEIKSLEDDIILGKEFYQNNLLLQNVNIPKLYFWYSQDEKYDLSPIKAIGEKASFAIEEGFEVKKVSYDIYNKIALNPIANFPTNITSWSIADEDGNIYIAVNGNVRPIYFY